MKMKKLLLLLLLSFNVQASDDDYTKLGYEHGCSSGNYVGGSSFYQYVKDQSYYKSNPAYQMAWDVAYERCKIESVRINNLITDSLMRGW
jgi:hypothetical protein